VAVTGHHNANGSAKEKISLGKIWSHFTCKQHFSLASTFFVAASKSLFFDSVSTKMQ